ncbi:DEAD/DEAH box helicase family protein [Streptomyces flaveus]|uniref:DNA-repair protein n=1 Tax=Streptomyces flaveus TaxID=66370 RepID=A0A917VQ68_9ACTN|nr:DEAD/DEAH box helicase family protein [Streptomyces flaveus]GGL03174.1 DNA-repair protein [Streptomyces flaveus]
MSKLRTLRLAGRYRNSLNNIVKDFYVPCLRAGVRYDRAVGYFTSGSLAVASEGIDEFERTGGKMRLIASPNLRSDDVEDIARGYELRQVVERAIVREVEAISLLSDEKLDQLGRVGRLIAHGQLDVKIAVMRSQRGTGIYHEKIGTIRDSRGDFVAFTGSLNETASAFLDNFESIQVFFSWKEEDARRATDIQQDFDDLWEGRTPNLEVLEFPTAARHKLIEIAAQRGYAKAPGGSTDSYGWPTLPESIALREYQMKAVTAWLEARGHGIFQMATGTGKTITGLSAADQLGRQLRSAGSPLVTIIVVPLLTLADQWTEELQRFGVTPIQCRDDWQNWEPPLRDALASMGNDNPKHLAAVVTNQTFTTPRFQRLLSKITIPMLLVADEVHNLGSEKLQSQLPENAVFRLGLSATPDRHLDPEGTQKLVDYFGDILIELGIEDAIRLDALTPYRYYPVLVPLSDEESELYNQLTKQIGRLYVRAASDAASEERLGHLLRKRANVLGHAEGKIPALRDALTQRRDEPFQLIYCAPGERPTQRGGSGIRQLDEAMALSGGELGIPTHPYTAKESPSVRREVLADFGSGKAIRMLASMRCLDEGVDIPDARIAYMLASGANPRQFIQRRGRVLRRAPGKKRADIIDFVAVPPGSEDLFDTERNLFRRELERCVEFARYAENQGYALSCLRELREHYDLMDL